MGDGPLCLASPDKLKFAILKALKPELAILDIRTEPFWEGSAQYFKSTGSAINRAHIRSDVAIKPQRNWAARCYKHHAQRHKVPIY